MRQMRNVFEAILKYGHDEDFSPVAGRRILSRPKHRPARAKSSTCWRSGCMRGEPLWHPEDRPDYSGLTGAVRPRE